MPALPCLADRLPDYCRVCPSPPLVVDRNRDCSIPPTVCCTVQCTVSGTDAMFVYYSVHMHSKPLIHSHMDTASRCCTPFPNPIILRRDNYQKEMYPSCQSSTMSRIWNNKVQMSVELVHRFRLPTTPHTRFVCFFSDFSTFTLTTKRVARGSVPGTTTIIRVIRRVHYSVEGYSTYEDTRHQACPGGDVTEADHVGKGGSCFSLHV